MFGIVVDKNGFKIDFYVLDSEGNPQDYELQNGEKVVVARWNIANAMNKPKWNGSEWIDTDPLPPIEPDPPVFNETEVLAEKVIALEMENLTLNEQTLDLDCRVVMLEIGI